MHTRITAISAGRASSRKCGHPLCNTAGSVLQFPVTTMDPIQLFPIQAVRKQRRMLGYSFFRKPPLCAVVKEYSLDSIDLRLYPSSSYSVNNEIAWIRMNIATTINNEVPLPRFALNMLTYGDCGPVKRHLRITGFELSPKLRGRSIGSQWYAGLLEPLFREMGIGIVRIEGSCLKKDGFGFWNKHGFSEKFLITEEADYDEIEFYSVLKDLQQSQAW